MTIELWPTASAGNDWNGEDLVSDASFLNFCPWVQLRPKQENSNMLIKLITQDDPLIISPPLSFPGQQPPIRSYSKLLVVSNVLLLQIISWWIDLVLHHSTCGNIQGEISPWSKGICMHNDDKCCQTVLLIGWYHLICKNRTRKRALELPWWSNG